MKNEEEEIVDSIFSKSIKNSLESKEKKEPVYEMTIESEKGRKEIINIYPNSKPEEIAYNFCKDNNLDFETLELMINQIKNLMKSIEQKKDQNNKNEKDTENENKLFYCKEPILEDSEEQQSLSTEKIIRTKSFKERILKNKENKEKENNNLATNTDIDINKNIDNNNNALDNNIKSIDNKNYFKINGDFQEKKRTNSKTNSIITNTINNCLELIEKEEKYLPSSISSFNSKLGSSSTQDKKDSIISKENINLFNIEKEKEHIKEESNNNYLVNKKNNNRNINISKSFINRIPKCLNNINNNNILNSNSRNNYYIINNSNNNNSNKKNKQKNIIELDSKNRTVSDGHKNFNQNKIKSLKISNTNNKFNIPTSSNSYYSTYSNKQKEIIKNNKNKNVLRIINMIKKNNIDLHQISSENLTKSNNSIKKKKSPNNNKDQKLNNNMNYKIKTKNNINYGINNKNNLMINNITSNFVQNSKDNLIYYDTTDRDPFYSLSKYEENSTLNNLIKNSMTTNSHYFTNLNSIKHEINMTILSKPQKKLINIPNTKNNNAINNKKINIKNKNYKTYSEAQNKKQLLSNAKLFKNFKSKILLEKSNNILNNKKRKAKEDHKKMSPISDNNRVNNKIGKNSNLKNKINLNHPLLIREFFREANLNKSKSNFKSPIHKANTSQTTMKNFMIKKNKTNMYKDSFINNNRILLTQSSRNNNLNDYSSTIKQKCNSFNDFNSNINNIFINLKYSNNKKHPSLLGYLDKFNIDNNSCFTHHQNKKKISKKRNISCALSSNKINSNSFGNKKSINDTSDKAIINNMNLNLNITTESNNNSYSYKNRKKFSNNYCPNLKNNINNKIVTKPNLNKKRPCYLFIKSQNSSPLSSSRSQRRKKNHSTLLQNSNININLLKKNKIVGALKEIFHLLSNKSSQIDIYKINKNNNLIIPNDIAKSAQFIIQNCEKNKNIINIKEFILKGSLLFDSLPFDEQISILNFSDK